MDIAAIYIQHAPALRRYLAARVDAADVDDVLHATFEQVIRDASTYEDRGYPITAWIYRIAHARMIDFFRYDRRRWTVALGDWPATTAGPEDVAARADYHRWIRAQIRTHLTDKQCAVIWLRFVEDLSLAETAERLGIPIGQVKALQWRGIAKLRMAIAPDDAPPMMAAMAKAIEPKTYYQKLPAERRKRRSYAAGAQCAAEGCTDRPAAHGYCDRHNHRLRKHGTVADKPVLCSVVGCDRKRAVKGMCRPHYDRARGRVKSEAT